GDDVQLGVLLVGRNRRLLQVRLLAGFEPQRGGLGDGDALAVGGVGASTDGDPDDGGMGIGVTLAGERLDMALAVLVDVIDDPRLLRLPARAFPGSLAD